MATQGANQKAQRVGQPVRCSCASDAEEESSSKQFGGSTHTAVGQSRRGSSFQKMISATQQEVFSMAQDGAAKVWDDAAKVFESLGAMRVQHMKDRSIAGPQTNMESGTAVALAPYTTLSRIV